MKILPSVDVVEKVVVEVVVVVVLVVVEAVDGGGSVDSIGSNIFLNNLNLGYKVRLNLNFSPKKGSLISFAQ